MDLFYSSTAQKHFIGILNYSSNIIGMLFENTFPYAYSFFLNLSKLSLQIINCAKQPFIIV